MEKRDIQFLIECYLKDDLNSIQQQQLLQIIHQNEMLVLEVLNSMQQCKSFETNALNTDLMTQSLQKVLTVDKNTVASIINIQKSSNKIRWWWVAASIILFIGVSVAFYLFPKKNNNISIVATQDVAAPITSRATITLADGTTVYLDSLNNGTVAQQGNTKLIKLSNGQIAYQTEDGQVKQELQYNTLSNPRGSKVIDMKLSDGTRVWLNAGSVIKYPLAFIGNERPVEISGEGYFEVAKSKDKPFTVKTNQLKVQVLGTHFNITAYTDDVENKVTLLEGAVKVAAAAKQVVLAPMQQAKISFDGALNINTDVNVDEVLAWKQNQFYFEETSLKDVMKQIERWYDVQVTIDANVPNKKFTGKMYRNMNVSEIFKILEGLDVHFKIDGKKIVVTK